MVAFGYFLRVKHGAYATFAQRIYPPLYARVAPAIERETKHPMPMTKKEIEIFAKRFEGWEGSFERVAIRDMKLAHIREEVRRKMGLAGRNAVELIERQAVPALNPMLGIIRIYLDRRDDALDEWLWGTLVMARIRSLSPNDFTNSPVTHASYAFYPKHDAAGNILGRDGKPIKYGIDDSEMALISDDWDDDDWLNYGRNLAEDNSTGCCVMARLLREVAESMTPPAGKKPKPRRQSRREPKVERTAKQKEAMEAYERLGSLEKAGKELSKTKKAVKDLVDRGNERLANLEKRLRSVKTQSLPTGSRGELLLSDDS